MAISRSFRMCGTLSRSWVDFVVLRASLDERMASPVRTTILFFYIFNVKVDRPSL
ncbi:MAG: hypothetical protein AAGG68_05520 [Bacteroidota bacterium]